MDKNTKKTLANNLFNKIKEVSLQDFENLINDEDYYSCLAHNDTIVNHLKSDIKRTNTLYAAKTMRSYIKTNNERMKKHMEARLLKTIIVYVERFLKHKQSILNKHKKNPDSLEIAPLSFTLFDKMALAKTYSGNNNNINPRVIKICGLRLENLDKTIGLLQINLNDLSESVATEMSK